MSTVYTFYAGDGISFLNLRFENDVKMYGTQTIQMQSMTAVQFENDVKMYGTQTITEQMNTVCVFENDVKMYGTQTNNNRKYERQCLRMM